MKRKRDGIKEKWAIRGMMVCYTLSWMDKSIETFIDIGIEMTAYIANARCTITVHSLEIFCLSGSTSSQQPELRINIGNHSCGVAMGQKCELGCRVYIRAALMDGRPDDWSFFSALDAKYKSKHSQSKPHEEILK